MKRNALITILCTFCVLWTFTGCTDDDQRNPTDEANQLLENVSHQKDYEHLLHVADSLDHAKSITEATAYYWRGYASNKLNQKRTAEFYWKKAMSVVTDFDDAHEMAIYARTASRLASLLTVKRDYEGALRMAIPAAAKMEEVKADTTSDYVNLLIFIGGCQSQFGGDKSSIKDCYEHAYVKHLENIRATHSDEAYKNAIVGLNNIVYNNIDIHHYDEAILWLKHLEGILTDYENQPVANPEYLDKQRARFSIFRATALQGQGKKAEGAAAYNAFLQTNFSKTSEGQYIAGDYLCTAGRWDEAADCYTSVGALISEFQMEYSLENFQQVLLKKYNANLNAGRKDTAVSVSMLICDSLDTAIERWKKNDATELSVIYDTQQRETELAEREAKIMRYRQVNTIVGLIVAVIIFVVYTLIRQRHARKLAEKNEQLLQAHVKLEQSNDQLEEKNEQLQVANARAEESSRMKSDFIHQISHEIRTPLHILSGFTQIITTPGMELDDASRSDINKQIIENTGRITSLVNKMIELSDASSQAVIERTDHVPAVQIAVQAAEKSLIMQASHLNFDMQVDAAAEEAALQTNLTAAVRALSLVLHNAAKFTRPAEAIQQGKSDAKKETARLHLSVAEGFVKFAVEDTGIGVPPAEAEHIFQEFVQLNEYYDGTGIGLTVARSLARRLGGDIVLDTAYTGGARFVMTLPVEG